MQNQYRKSPRARWADYNEGEYFVTVCTKHKVHYFGEISGGVIHYSPIGQFLSCELQNVSKHHPGVDIPAFVVMPNHFHAIVIIHPTDPTRRFSTSEYRYEPGNLHKPQSNLHVPFLSIVVGSLKSAVSRYAHRSGFVFQWQSRFHDHIILNYTERYLISDYIAHNVEKWDTDCFYIE